MIEMKSSVEARTNTKQRTGGSGGTLFRTEFIGPKKDDASYPQAFLIESQGERLTRSHFHQVDQWQVIVNGSGKFGRHDVRPITVHYAKAHTPYGPLHSNVDGLSYFTFRAGYDPGAQYLPESRDKLKPTGRPFQVTCPLQTVSLATLKSLKSATLEPIPEIHDSHGLAAFILTVGPGLSASGPDPKSGNGQYYLITQGSILHGGQELPQWSCIYISSDESPFSATAGESGLEAVVLQFPRQAEQQQIQVKQLGTKKWQCVLCAFSYDEAAGMPADGIAPGTLWAEVPESWTCPDCGASKSDFEMVEV